MRDISKTICHLERSISVKWQNKEDKAASSKNVKSWMWCGICKTHRQQRNYRLGEVGTRQPRSGGFRVGGSRQKAGGCFTTMIRQPCWEKWLIISLAVWFDRFVTNCEVVTWRKGDQIGDAKKETGIKNIFQHRFHYIHPGPPWALSGGDLLILVNLYWICFPIWNITTAGLLVMIQYFLNTYSSKSLFLWYLKLMEC